MRTNGGGGGGSGGVKQPIPHPNLYLIELLNNGTDDAGCAYNGTCIITYSAIISLFTNFNVTSDPVRILAR